MNWQINYITWIHLLTSIISIQLVLTVLNVHHVKGKLPFISMMSLAAFWSIILTMESAVPTMEMKIFLSQFEYISNMFIPLMFLLFILSYGLGQKQVIKRFLPYLVIVPVITLILVFTHPYHQLIWTGFSWSPAGNNILVYHHGPVFYFSMAYSMGLIVFSNGLLINFAFKNRGSLKSKTGTLLTGSMFAFATCLVYILGLSPVQGLDVSPMGILITGLVYYVAITREQFFDLIPFSQQLMLEKLKDGVIVTDSEGIIKDFTPAASRALKITEPATGTKLTELLPYLHEVLHNFPVDHEVHQEIHIQSQGAGWFQVTRYPLQGAKGKFLGNLLILHDINHRKETEIKLRTLAEELGELNRMKDNVYSIISHDLRNPFNTILGFSQLLVESWDDFEDADRRHFIGNIQSASQSAFNLLENLLEWSLMQLGKFEIAKTSLSLYKQAEDVFALLTLMAHRKKIILENQIDASHHVYADRNMLAAVLRNLLSNAIKFTPEGGKVEICSRQASEMIEISIQDNGIGIHPDRLKELFTPDQMRSQQGTSNEKGAGLGLLLVKDFVEKNSGTIHAKSEPGKGSLFIFTLPGINN